MLRRCSLLDKVLHLDKVSQGRLLRAGSGMGSASAVAIP